MSTSFGRRECRQNGYMHMPIRPSCRRLLANVLALIGVALLLIATIFFTVQAAAAATSDLIPQNITVPATVAPGVVSAAAASLVTVSTSVFHVETLVQTLEAHVSSADVPPPPQPANASVTAAAHVPMSNVPRTARP